MRRRGFTLIELLVVIAMIIILVALLAPVFLQVRIRARQAACASNLRQIAQAGLIYLQDHDERFPSCCSLIDPPYMVDPHLVLQPYLRSWDVFYCPERHTELSRCWDPKDHYRPDARCMGYGYNGGSGRNWTLTSSKGDGLLRPDHERYVMVGVTLSEVALPSRCFFFGDTNDDQILTLLREAMPGERRGGDPLATSNDMGQRYEPARHGEGNNFVFVDGHVQWLRFPGGRWGDGGPWVVPDMSMYSRTGHWESDPVP